MQQLKDMINQFVINRIPEKESEWMFKGYTMFFILFLLTLFGGIAILPSIISGIQHEKFISTLILFGSYLIIPILLFVKSINYNVRSYFLCMAMFIAGYVVMGNSPLISSARLWFLSTTSLACLLISGRSAIIFFIVSILVMLFAGYETNFAINLPVEPVTHIWIITIITFVLINIIIVGATHLIVYGLKKSEIIRKENLERLEFTLQGANLGFWDWDIQKDTIIFSDIWANILAYHPSEIEYTYNFFKRHIHPDDLTHVMDRLAQHLGKKTEIYESEHRLRTKNGKWIWVIDRGKVVKWNNDGNPIRVTGIIAEITERKYVEEALREQLEFSDSLIETAQTIILVLDSHGRIVRFNKFMEDLTGFHLNEVKGKYWFNTFIPLEDRQNIKLVFQKTMNNGSQGYVNQIVTKNNKKIFIEWYEKILKDKDGNADGMLAIGYDITERKSIQDQLNQSQKLDSVGRLAGGIAHDFNNMLTIILGHSDLILHTIDENDKYLTNIKEIQNAAERAANMTQQLLGYARKQNIMPEKINLNVAINSMITMLKRLVEEHIDIVCEPADNLWSIKIDPSQLDQILVNLCINSKDAIDGPGKIIIETGMKKFDEEYCSKHPEFVQGDFVLLSVSDNGCGMNKEILQKLFDPFFTTKKVGSGTGLGLSTVYGIVKQNNGFINVYSEIDQGTTFNIYLPRFINQTEVFTNISNNTEIVKGTETILIVEDEMKILELTESTLQLLGYTTLSASTPNKAIKMATDYAGTIDLLLTDVIMPEMNGKELSKQITKIYPNIKHIFMSGYTSNIIAHQGLLDNDIIFIQKPFSRVALSNKIHQVLN